MLGFMPDLTGEVSPATNDLLTEVVDFFKVSSLTLPGFVGLSMALLLVLAYFFMNGVIGDYDPPDIGLILVSRNPASSMHSFRASIFSFCPT